MSFRLVNTLPEGCEIQYQELLYNTSSFLKSNNDLPQLHYYWVNKTTAVAMAHVAFSLEESEAISPVKAPCGGIEFSENLRYEDLCTFIIFLQKELRSRGVKFLRFYQPPENYQKQGVLNQVFSDLDFIQKSERVYQGISVEVDDLLDKMAIMEQRRLRKCLKAGFAFKALGSRQLPEVYRTISRWRELSQKPLSMNWSELSLTRKHNPNAYLPFGIYDEKKMVAATIAIRVSNSVLYHFYPAHDPEYNNYSPMVMLVDNLYGWCRKNGFGLLDLGTSYTNNKMNKSLMRFKSHIGGVESKAKIFRKTLSSQ